jgi:hypothetical protein
MQQPCDVQVSNTNNYALHCVLSVIRHKQMRGHIYIYIYIYTIIHVTALMQWNFIQIEIFLPLLIQQVSCHLFAREIDRFVNQIAFA